MQAVVVRVIVDPKDDGLFKESIKKAMGARIQERIFHPDLNYLVRFRSFESAKNWATANGNPIMINCRNIRCVIFGAQELKMDIEEYEKPVTEEGVKQRKPWGYLWEHDDEYKRLTKDDLNNEAIISLCEMVLNDLRLEMRYLAEGIRLEPNNPTYIRGVKAMQKRLQSEYINALTFGHGNAVAKSFDAMLNEAGYKEKGLTKHDYKRQIAITKKEKAVDAGTSSKVVRC